MSSLFIGALSGTSMDSIDAAVFNFVSYPPELIGHCERPFPVSLRKKIQMIVDSRKLALKTFIQLDVCMGREIAKTVNTLLKITSLSKAAIAAIGSHGQTLYHAPNSPYPSSLQIGDPNIIVTQTGITTVSDFRRRDMAYKGQGAPLAPHLHATLFRSREHDRIILNIGGIANVTILPADPNLPITGFDTGPGNLLMDAWISHHRPHSPYDQDGKWAAEGKVQSKLLHHLLKDPYFKRPSPKSTGREYFNLGWLLERLKFFKPFSPKDVQATLLALTVESITMALQRWGSSPNAQIYVCGGGALNPILILQLQKRLVNHSIQSTEVLGILPKHLEPLLFAWLAKQTLERKTGNIPTVTGAQRETLLGGIYLANFS
ncbi:MAG: anhydro-N-acetylmuramic acid kinase [Gammaproteobacteria bacterium]|nr:anhydro-N-acetylmuramic acid kinase [Gammaproteobacteria bacterium]